MPNFDAIQSQTEVQWSMRAPLLDFLSEAHQAFLLLPETLHLTVNLLDRYCSLRIVHKNSFQLVGCVALLIAAKYGDFKERVPTIRELNTMCCSMYTNEMFTCMERHFISTLNWIVGHPTISCFQKIFLNQKVFSNEKTSMNGKVDNQQLECSSWYLEALSWYLAEISLYHKDFITIQPSIMATATLELARNMLGLPPPRWPKWVTQPDQQVVLSLMSHLRQPPAIVTAKYSTPSLFSIARVVDVFLLKQQVMSQRLVRQAPTSKNLIHQIARPGVMQVIPSRSASQSPPNTRCRCRGLTNRISLDKQRLNGIGSHSSSARSNQKHKMHALHMDLPLVCKFCMRRCLGHRLRNFSETRLLRHQWEGSRVLARQSERENSLR
jgi:hypothetical protein